MARRDSGRETKRERRRPTDGELEILGVLWEHGPTSVREVWRRLEATRPVGYTTVLKLMQIMHDKGTLDCDKSVRPQVYRTAQPQRKTQRQIVGDLVDRVFAGSPGSLVLQALASKKSTPEERQRIRELLDRIEEDDA